jgi:dTMP kinase
MFIVFEGLDRVGKTTAAKILAERKGWLYTREPGGTKTGEEIRNIIKSGGLSPYTILYLMLAAREEHEKQVIIPELEKGGTVVCDRYIYSTIAYQGFGQGLDLPKRLGGLTPDVTFLIQNERFEDLDSKDELENEYLQARAKEGYAIISRFKGVSTIKGSIEEIQNQVDKILSKLNQV